MSDTLRLATRGSDLALRQAATVGERLSSPRLEVELVEVSTTGDELRDELIHRLGKTGAFVRALDEKVLAGEVDAAVHSLKDVPTEMPDDLVVAAVPERAAAGDLLVTPDGTDLRDLPPESVVGTGSLRRGAQVLRQRPDLVVEPIRGNVDTRVAKLLAGTMQAEHEARVEDDRERKGHAGEDEYDSPYERTIEEWFDSLSELERRSLEYDLDVEYDALVMAEAGLNRAGLLHHVEYERLSTREFVPAPGQGALAVTASDPDVVKRVQSALDYPRSRVETTVERTVLAELGGGCVAPIGVHAILQGEHVRTDAVVLSRDGETVVDRSRDLPVEQHARAARDLAADMREEGAADLIEEAKREVGALDDETAESDGSAGDEEAGDEPVDDEQADDVQTDGETAEGVGGDPDDAAADHLEEAPEE
jgi:hydroxymethylbilane synthase